MSKCKYRISKKAIEDLDKIWKYTFENWSIEQADRYYNLIPHCGFNSPQLAAIIKFCFYIDTPLLAAE